MSVYKIITEAIIAALNKGVVPWRKTWSGDSFAPQNLISRKPYRGVNVFLLSTAEFRSPFWLTFNQAKSLGGHVKRRERGRPVVLWKWVDRVDDDTGEVYEYPLLRYSRVFNLEQCGLPARAMPLPPELTARSFEPIRRCEQVVEKMPHRPRIDHDGADRAYYSPLDDSVHLPRPNQFDTAEAYYSTLFHELSHATGHQSRLNRTTLSRCVHIGWHDYSREELIAEMAAAFLCGHCNIQAGTLENSASYIAGWLKALKNDQRLVIQAAASAQKAADYILNAGRSAQSNAQSSNGFLQAA